VENRSWDSKDKVIETRKTANYGFTTMAQTTTFPYIYRASYDKPCKLAFYGMTPLVVVLVAYCLKLEMKITPAKYINCLSVYIH